LARLTAKSVRVLRDRRVERPEAANQRVKFLRAMFTWAVEEELVGVNPARDVRLIKTGSTGFHCWSVDEVERFEQRHAIGTKARLALALLLWTGVRRSDVVLLGKQHARGGWLKFTPQKNRNRSPVTIEIPILPKLQRVIDLSPTGDLTFLVSELNRPFSASGFGSWFRTRCNEAGLPHCSAHGLRKAGATIAAENGASEHQLMSIFGWATLKEAERYTKAARRKKMAGDAMSLLLRGK
jgi:integrase